jgi:hypothetical protein
MVSTTWTPPKFAEVLALTPPETLYHYTSQSGLLGIVETNELWATKLQYMNDDLEFRIALSMAREQLEAIKEHGNAASIAAYALQNSLAGLDDINIFSVCFCETGDLLSQWRGYSASGGGFSIGFDTNVLIDAVHSDNFILGKCIYDTDVQKKDCY